MSHSHSRRHARSTRVHELARIQDILASNNAQKGLLEIGRPFQRGISSSFWVDLGILSWSNERLKEFGMWPELIPALGSGASPSNLIQVSVSYRQGLVRTQGGFTLLATLRRALFRR